ncbi:MAG: hypothetical protein IH626_12460 [Rhodospirillales bacterium]|nr:hypothetical protein [Rhodospirillales bacterium]
MGEIVGNPWIVGLGAGVVSGLVVHLILRLLFSRGENTAYRRNVAFANREVLVALRPSISEGAPLSEDVIRLLIEATARRFSVHSKDMYGIKEVCEDLIKEIMDSSFINSKIKQDYCKSITEVYAFSQNERFVKEIEKYGTGGVVPRYLDISDPAMLVSMLGGVVFGLIAFYIFIFNQPVINSVRSASVIIAIMVVVSAIFIFIIYMIYKSTILRVGKITVVTDKGNPSVEPNGKAE